MRCCCWQRRFQRRYQLMSSPVGPHASANGGKRGHHDTRYSTGQGCFGRVRFNGHRNVENPEPSRQGRSTKYVRVAIVVHISEALRGISIGCRRAVDCGHCMRTSYGTSTL